MFVQAEKPVYTILNLTVTTGGYGQRGGISQSSQIPMPSNKKTR